MPEKIKIIRFITKSSTPELINHNRIDSSTRKNINLSKRFYKENYNIKKTRLIGRSSLLYSFKANWFCKECLQVFHLKPLRKYKSLLEYDTNCPQCKSVNTIHNDDISEAILDKKSPSELLIMADGSGTSINFNPKNKLEYYPFFFATKEKEASIVDKEYFYLES